MLKGRDLIARKRKSKTDEYETPEWATQALLKVEDFPGTILEPACGDGKIVHVLRNHGYEVEGSDIRTDIPIKGLYGGINFLKSSHSKWQFHHVITNPPFSQAEAFIRRALDIAIYKVAMFLPMTFLEAEKRREWLDSSPLDTIYIFSSRVTLWPRETSRPRNGGTRMYAWFVWDHDTEQEHPIIKLLPDKEPKKPRKRKSKCK